MPYRIKAGESVPQNIQRIVTEEIDSAVEQLSRHVAKNRDTAIHEARKSIKKVRGVLKLMRPELGKVYREENSALRDLGRNLSELRDASAMIESFDHIVETHASELKGRSLKDTRSGLEERKRDKERSGDVAKVMIEAASGLRLICTRVAAWPLTNDGFDALLTGLRDTYQAGRKAMRLAEAKERPDLYHEWRKRAKDHWYHIRLLEGPGNAVIEAREKSLHDLETWLGDDHNLVVLRDQLREQPQFYGGEEGVTLFVQLARAQQRELRAKALALGQSLYSEKPKQFVRRMERLWLAWQTQTASPSEEQHPKKRKPVESHRKKKSAA